MNKITEINSIYSYSGHDVFNLKDGSIVKVISFYSETNHTEVGEFLIITDKRSLVSLSTGETWGNDLEGYEFTQVNSIRIN